jgi:glycosyltransferase involved in cell wall biosynthesis
MTDLPGLMQQSTIVEEAGRRHGKCLVLLEYGVPEYREFIYEHLATRFAEVTIVHTGERFRTVEAEHIQKGICLQLGKEVTLCFFNPWIIRSFDVVITTINWRKPHTWLWVPFFRRPSWIFWGQGPGRACGGIVGAFKRWIMRKGSGFVVYTDGGKKALEALGIAPAFTEVAYNTLEVTNAGPTGPGRYFLYVGRLQRRKRLDELFRAIVGTPFKVVIVGESEGEEGAMLAELAGQLGLQGQVEFHPGTFSEAVLKNYFDGAWAYVSPGHVGLGVVHSFSYGKPVVTCADARHAPEFEYCSVQNSYLYGKGQKLADVLAHVVGDSALRGQKGTAAYEFYRDRLDSGNVIRAFDRVLDGGRQGL